MIKQKLHVGCGTVYLDGYINIDVSIPGQSFLASDRPDLVAKNITTVDNYYRYDVNRSDIEKKVLESKSIVCDLFANIKNLPFESNSVSEIRSVQVFEHFTYKEGEQLLAQWHRLLEPGGLVHIDIPDLDGTVQGYLNADNPTDKLWYVRLLFGNQKNEFGIHKAMYSKAMIQTLLEKIGFTQIKFLPNIHFYPAFAVEVRK